MVENGADVIETLVVKELRCEKLGVAQAAGSAAAAPTAAATTITNTAGSGDFAWADVTTTTPYGLADQSEARSLLEAVRINQLRISEVIVALQTIGIMA